MAGSSVLAIVCFSFGIIAFKKKFDISEHIGGLKDIQKILENKYFIDEIYFAVVVNPLKMFGKLCAHVVDKIIIDGFVLGLGRGTRDLGKRFKAIQTGDVQTYAFLLMLGLVTLLWFAFRTVMQ